MNKELNDCLNIGKFNTQLKEQLPELPDGKKARFTSEHGLSVYDAAYLDVSVRHHIPLATIDKQLAAAAKSAGLGF